MEEELTEKDKAGEDRAEDAEAEEDSGEVQASRTSSQPRSPSSQERREHAATHCPFRSWCEHCVRGQGAEYAHSTVVGSNAEDGVPRVLMDYAFLTEDVHKEEDEHKEAVEATTSLTM